MESEIRNLIKLRGENFHNQNYDFSSIDFNFIGKVDSLQDLDICKVSNASVEIMLERFCNGKEIDFPFLNN